MELTLEAVALFALKLVHETDGGSPVLRDDPVMEGYDREVFGLLVRRGGFGWDSIQTGGMYGSSPQCIEWRRHGNGSRIAKVGD